MENYEYNKAYPFDSEDMDIAPDEVEQYFYERCASHLDHVADCEQIAEEFSGRIKAKIDYENYTASIEIWCCYVEFAHGKFMSILHEISQYAMLIRFEPLTSGDLHIEILMPYFVSASSSDKNE